MTTATAPAAIEPITVWDADPIADYTTKAAAAASVAWSTLTHSQGFGPDIARMIGPADDRRPLPEGMESEDLYGFLFDLVQDAAEIGYVAAQIEMSGFAPRWDRGELLTSDVARAVAVLLRIDVIEDDETFDPEWRARLEAEWRKVPA